MPIYEPIENISMRWQISEDEVAIADVEINCTPTRDSTSFHLFTLGIDDQLDVSSIVGTCGDRGVLAFEKQNQEARPGSKLEALDFVEGASPSSKSTREKSYAAAVCTTLEVEALDSGFAEDASLASPSIKKVAPRAVSSVHDVGALELDTGLSNLLIGNMTSYQCDLALAQEKQIFDVYCSEHGVKELVGTLELENYRLGPQLYLHLFRLVKPEPLKIIFTLYQQQVCNVTSTYLTKPQEATYWRTTTVSGLPALNGHVKLSFVPCELEYNLIADISAKFATHTIADGETINLIVSATDLGQIPLDRTIEVQLSRAVALKAVSITAKNCCTVVQLKDDGDYLNVKYSLEFDAETDLELCNRDEVVLASVYIAGGPMDRVELRQNSKYVDDCPVRYSSASNRAAVQIESNNDGEDSFDHLQVSFEQRYSKDVSTVWVPHILNASEGRAVVVLLGTVDFCVAGTEWTPTEQTCEYWGPTMTEMALYRKRKIPKSKALIRDTSYVFSYAIENAYSSRVSVNLSVVLDIREVSPGEAIIVISTTDFWREPLRVLIDGVATSNGELLVHEKSVAVLLRQESNKRDIVVEFSWLQLCLSRTRHLFNEAIPYISCECDNAKFKIDGVDFEEGLISSAGKRFNLPKKSSTARFTSDGPIWLQLSKKDTSEPEFNENRVSQYSINLTVWAAIVCLFGFVIWRIYPLTGTSSLLWAARTNDLEIELEKTLEKLSKMSEKAELIQRQLDLGRS